MTMPFDITIFDMTVGMLKFIFCVAALVAVVGILFLAMDHAINWYVDKH